MHILKSTLYSPLNIRRVNRIFWFCLLAWKSLFVVSDEAKPSIGTALVGIDLGCKEAATASNGKNSQMANTATCNRWALHSWPERRAVLRRYTPKSLTGEKITSTNLLARWWIPVLLSLSVTYNPWRCSEPPWLNLFWTPARVALRQYWNTSSLREVLSLQKWTKRFQPRPVRAVGSYPSAVRKVEPILE